MLNQPNYINKGFLQCKGCFSARPWPGLLFFSRRRARKERSGKKDVTAAGPCGSLSDFLGGTPAPAQHPGTTWFVLVLVSDCMAKQFGRKVGRNTCLHFALLLFYSWACSTSMRWLPQLTIRFATHGLKLHLLGIDQPIDECVVVCLAVPFLDLCKFTNHFSCMMVNH